MARTTMRETDITFEVFKAREGGYWARALGHPIFTEAESICELRAMVDDAVRCHFESVSVPTKINLIHIEIDPKLSPDFTFYD